MLYFIKENTIHRYPPGKRCSARYEQERLGDVIPYDAKKCPYCLALWPQDKD